MAMTRPETHAEDCAVSPTYDCSCSLAERQRIFDLESMLRRAEWLRDHDECDYCLGCEAHFCPWDERPRVHEPGCKWVELLAAADEAGKA